MVFNANRTDHLEREMERQMDDFENRLALLEHKYSVVEGTTEKLSEDLDNRIP